jgi:hypothetical protein
MPKEKISEGPNSGGNDDGGDNGDNGGDDNSGDPGDDDPFGMLPMRCACLPSLHLAALRIGR